MTKVIISGCNGHMGRVVAQLCQAEPDIQIVAGSDVNTAPCEGFPVYADPMEFPGEADCIIDFSSPKALPGLLRCCRAKGCGVVLATTGYSQEELEAIEAAAQEVRVFRSANMSLGVNVLTELVRKAAQLLEGYDIEIVERHHNRKVDAPSGTALMLADAAAEAIPYDAQYTYDRHSRRQPRDKAEIGISSVRGGTIVGEHEVIFAGRDEVLTLHHSAMSREIFASGAVRAARFLARQTKPGLYDMQQLVSFVSEE